VASSFQKYPLNYLIDFPHIILVSIFQPSGKKEIERFVIVTRDCGRFMTVIVTDL
jgi:hypothetical protein